MTVNTTGFTTVVAVAEQEHYTTGTVISKDGTTIGYRQLGHGPGVILVQGTMGTAQHFMQLAGALADSFTVYVPDRRGRGISGSGGNDYSTQKDVEDLDALLAKTGAHNVFGLSAGALIALQAALALPAIRKVAVFEPVLFINGLPAALLTRFEQEMAQGKVVPALITAMKAAQMGPPIFNVMPRWLLERLTARAMAQEEKKGSGDYPPMRELASTLNYDLRVVAEMNGPLDRFKAIRSDVLLMGGGKSPAYLKVALDTLEKSLPAAKRIEFAGLGHAAPWNADRRGQPEQVAQALRQFFV